MLESFSYDEPDPGSQLQNIKGKLREVFENKDLEKQTNYLEARLKKSLKFFSPTLHKQIIFDALESYIQSIKFSNFPKNIDPINQFEKDLKFLILVLAKDPKDLIKLYIYIKNGRFFAPCPDKKFHQKQISEMIEQIQAIKIL